jgi:hypothetical protein
LWYGSREEKEITMRKDMSKVVIERPRWGHACPNAKTRLRVCHHDEVEKFDDLPQRISGSRSKHLGRKGHKSFSDLLGPLQKYLRRQVGRPWNVVHSEMAQTLDRRKVTGQHIFEHVEREVELHVEIDEDGVVFHQSWSGRYLVRGLYVHPRTGLLCWQEAKYGKYVSRGTQLRQQRQTCERQQISYDQSYVRINGVWYVGDYVAEDNAQAPESPPARDAYDTPEKLRERVEDFGTRYWNGKRWMQLIGKRKCSPQELQKAGLRNAKQSESGLSCFWGERLRCAPQLFQKE